MTSDTTYEVQVKQDGNWTIHENFKDHQQDDALASAKHVFEERRLIEAVKVVKEAFDPDTETFNDSVIFRDDREELIAKRARAKAAGAVGDPGKGPKDGSGGSPAKTKDRKQKKKDGRKQFVDFTGFTLRSIGGVVASLVLAAISAALASEFVGGTVVFGIYFVGDAKLYMVIGVFAGAFLLSVAVISIILTRRFKLKVRAKRHRTPPKPELSLFQVAAFLVTRPFLWIYLAWKTAKSQEAAKPAAPAAPVTEEKPAESAEPEPLSPTAQKLETYMMDFLSRALDGSRSDKETMDNFNRFGVSLFVAGACEILTTNGQLDANSHARILTDCVRVMGFKKSHAASFSQRYEDYLMADSRYMQMFQDGRKAIVTYLADDTIAPASLDAALDEWNKPKTVEMQSDTVTVMFVDVVAPPAQANGVDADAARELADAHRRIVGEALNAHAGMEVKHTPKGIMASFAETSNGVKAAVDMHRKAALFNQTGLALPLRLKIGISAGEPIAEEDDLHGKVVRLSAVIVERAVADQILLSEAAARLCEGVNFDFIDCGGLEPTAAGGEVGLFEVQWSAAPAAVDPEPLASTAPNDTVSGEDLSPS